MRSRWIWLAVLFLFATLAGYWLARTAAPETPMTSRSSVSVVQHPALDDTPMPQFRREDRQPRAMRDKEALEAGAISNQRAIIFNSREALEAFLANAGDGIRILGRLDAIHALRVAFLDWDDLAKMLNGDEELSLMFPVDVPAPGDVPAQPGAVALENGLLEWLGIDGMDAAGQGVRIAILDTGIFSHESFAANITRIDLLDGLANSTDPNGHGTAVASMLAGNSRLMPGVVPLADFLDVRIANEFGSSNSWLLAQGIFAAVDAGAHIINISLGSPGDSAIVRQAIAYANAAGVAIVAPSGNQGLDRLSFPAANDGVIAVGAVDATGNHVAFSNQGAIDMAAPGFGINAAYPDNLAVRVDGTSFSSPIVAGSIAWVMSTQGVSATQAVALINQSLNEAGPAGVDPAHGAGLPALDRVANRNQSGIFDAAVASHHIIPPGNGVNYPRAQVVVQNRGTEPLINTSLSITHPGGTTTANITMLRPNAVQTITIPISIQAYQSGDPLTFDSRVSLSQHPADANPSNNRRIDLHIPDLAR